MNKYYGSAFAVSVSFVFLFGLSLFLYSCGQNSPASSFSKFPVANTPLVFASQAITIHSNSLDSVIIIASSAQYTSYKLEMIESNQSASSTPVIVAPISKWEYHVSIKPDKTYIFILSQYKKLSDKPYPTIIISSPDTKNQKRISTILTKAQQPSTVSTLIPNALTTSTGSQIYLWRLTYMIEVNWQGTNGNLNGWIPDNYFGTNATPYTFDLSPDSGDSNYYLDTTGQPYPTIDMGQFLLPDGSYLLVRQKLTNSIAIAIQSLSIFPSDITLKAGTSKWVTLKATLSTGETRDVYDYNVIWNSNNSSVANAAMGGISAKNAGTAQITASLSGMSAVSQVTVKDKMPYEVDDVGYLFISLFSVDGCFDGSRGGQLFITEPDGTEIIDGQQPKTGHGIIRFHPEDGSYQSDYYIYNPPPGDYSIRMKQDGGSCLPDHPLTTWVVSSINGFEQIKSVEANGSWEVGSIKVNAPNKNKLKSITITPDKATIYIHNIDVTKTQQQLNANGKYTNGTSQNINDMATWVADPSGLVTLTNGLTKAVKPGKAIIKASLNSIISNDAEIIIACRRYPYYCQQDYQDVYDHHRFFFPIAKKGCALTSLSMILDATPMPYSYKPDQLNTIFNLGYNSVTKISLGYWDAGVRWTAIDKLTNPKKISFHMANIPPSDVDLNPKGYFEDFELKNLGDINQYLDACMPVIVGVRIDQTPSSPGTPYLTHYILVTGRDGNKYFINDPWDPNRTTLDHYDNKIYAYVVYKINF